VKADYSIIRASNDYLGPFKYFYSTNLLNWAMVPNVDPRIEWQNRLDQSLFYGDPTIKTKFKVFFFLYDYEYYYMMMKLIWRYDDGGMQI
jgi:hypothetical protein